MNRLIQYTYPRSVYFNRSALGGLESEISRLFDSAFADYVPSVHSNRFAVDLFADKDNVYVRAELPGIAREDINLEIVDGTLTINATRKDNSESFALTRNVSLPDSVAEDKVTAAYVNGILTVTLPKQEQAKPRKIDISIN